MARSLQFLHASGPLEAAILKVDRGKLYGSRDLETLDRDGHRCTLATLAADGHSLIPVGGTGIAHLDAEGLWLDGEDLKPVAPDGSELPLKPSSFEAPIALDTPVEVDHLLEHSIRLTYALDLLGPVPPPLASALEAGTIYGFPFSWRGGPIRIPPSCCGARTEPSGCWWGTPTTSVRWDSSRPPRADPLPKWTNKMLLAAATIPSISACSEPHRHA